MKNIINKPHLFFWGLIPLFLVLGLIKPDEVIDVNIHDTYFVLLNFHLVIFLSLLLFLIGFGYWFVLKLDKCLLRVLTILHIVFLFRKFYVVNCFNYAIF